MPPKKKSPRKDKYCKYSLNTELYSASPLTVAKIMIVWGISALKKKREKKKKRKEKKAEGLRIRLRIYIRRAGQAVQTKLCSQRKLNNAFRMQIFNHSCGKPLASSC